MSDSHLDWQGDKIVAKMKVAARRAINRTLADCVATAVPLAPFKFGVLRRSIQARMAKEIRPHVIAGYWGSFSLMYAIFQELGTSKMAAHPYLRPSADRNYPRFFDYYRQELAS